MDSRERGYARSCLLILRSRPLSVVLRLEEFLHAIRIF